MKDGIEQFLVNQHNSEIDPREDRKVGCPSAYAFVLLAERFGQDPITWPYQHEAPAVLRLLGVLGTEGEMKAQLARWRGKPFYLDEG